MSNKNRLTIAFLDTVLIFVIILIFCYLAHSEASTQQKTVYITISVTYDIPITITSIVEDLDRNNEVNFTDINLVRAAYGSFPADANWNLLADVDKSGQVDFVDINMVRSAYGERLVMQ